MGNEAGRRITHGAAGFVATRQPTAHYERASAAQHRHLCARCIRNPELVDTVQPRRKP